MHTYKIEIVEIAENRHGQDVNGKAPDHHVPVELVRFQILFENLLATLGGHFAASGGLVDWWLKLEPEKVCEYVAANCSMASVYSLPF